jgi:hypothetical protein
VRGSQDDLKLAEQVSRWLVWNCGLVAHAAAWYGVRPFSAARRSGAVQMMFPPRWGIVAGHRRRKTWKIGFLTGSCKDVSQGGR